MTTSSTIWRRAAAWSAAAFVVALLLQVSAVIVGGSLSALIVLGEESPTKIRTVIESDFDDVFLFPGGGHDGQQNYVIATDPLGLERSGAVDNAGYRYRRILYPALAGAFGTLRGDAVVIGLAALGALGLALAAGSLSVLASRIGAPQWVPLAVVANPGLWDGVSNSSGDALALGLALVGVVLWYDRRIGWAVVALVAMALTKETHLLIAFGLAGATFMRGDRKNALVLIGVPLGAVLAWVVWVETTISTGLATRGNFAWPLMGIVEGSEIWGGVVPWQNAMLVVAAIGLIIGAYAPWRAKVGWVRWLAWPWVAIALVGSKYIWAVGTDAARVFAPAGVFGFLALGIIEGQRRSLARSKEEVG